MIPEKTESFKKGLVVRCQERGNNDAFVNYIAENFDKLSRDQKDYKNKILVCKEHKFLEDLLLQENLLAE